MKNTIHGFDHKEAVKMGLTNDDLLLLRWFYDFMHSKKMSKKYIKEIDDMGYWVYYSKVIDDLPILFNGKSLRANKTKLQRMIDGNLSKVIIKNIVKEKGQNGTKVFWTLNDDTYSLLLEGETEEKSEEKLEDNHYTNLCSTTTQNCVVPLHKNVQSDNSIIDNNINNNNIPFYSNNNNIDIEDDINSELEGKEKKEKKEQATYCNLEEKDVVEEKINDIMIYTACSYSKYQCKQFLNVAKGDVELFKYTYDKVLESLKTDKDKTIKNMVSYIVGAVKRESKKFYSNSDDNI